jgi:hypothetical protein
MIWSSFSKKRLRTLTDGGIVYTVNNHLLNPSSLERFLLLKVSWDLLGGSGGCKGTWKTDENHFLSRALVSDVNTLGIGEGGRENLYRRHRRGYHGG